MTADAYKHQLTVISDHVCNWGQNSHSRWPHFALGGPEHDKNFTGMVGEFSVKKTPCISNGWKERTIYNCPILNEMRFCELIREWNNFKGSQSYLGVNSYHVQC